LKLSQRYNIISKKQETCSIKQKKTISFASVYQNRKDL
jgi:hypothetical protein